jgi:hypothetical protein
MHDEFFRVYPGTIEDSSVELRKDLAQRMRQALELPAAARESNNTLVRTHER